MRLRTAVKSSARKNQSTVAVWFRAVRFHFVPPSFLPAILCSLIAWVNYRVMDLEAFLLVILGVTINHFGLNMLDDVCDYLHFIDRQKKGDKNPYTGGSGVITEGLLSVRQVAVGSAVCFAITVLIGIYLTYTKGWPVLAFGLFGLFCSIFYTLPPIKFGYRGLGELALLVNFGPTIGLGAYYVQTGKVAIEPLMISLVLGSMMWSMIIINEIPDYEDDRLGNKMNLVARFGKEMGITLYVAGLVLSYGILVSSVLLRISPPIVLLGLVSLPLAVKSVRILKKNYQDALKMVPANLSMIKVHFYTGVAMIAGYILYLFLGNMPVS